MLCLGKIIEVIDFSLVLYLPIGKQEVRYDPLERLITEMKQQEQKPQEK